MEELYTLFLGSFSYFLRVFSCLVLFPLEYGAKGFFQRTIISFSLAGFLSNQFGFVDSTVTSIAFDVLIGFVIGFTLIFPIWVVTMFGELSDNLRGVNIASFYDTNSHENINYISKILKFSILILLLQNNLFEKLLSIIIKSYNSVGSLDILAYASILFTTSIKTLSLSFELALPFAIVFLSIHLVIAFVSKMFPQVSFFGETFVLKLFAFVLLLIIFKDSISYLGVVNEAI